MDDNKEKDVNSIDEAKKIGGRIGMIIAVWFILIGKLFFPAEMNLMQEKAEEVCSELVDDVAIFIGVKDINPYQINEFLPSQSILKRYIYPGKSDKQYMQRHEYIMANGSERARYRTILLGKNQYGMIEPVMGISSPWELGEYFYDKDMQNVKKVMYKSSSESIRGNDRITEYVFLNYEAEEKTSNESIVELAENDVVVEMTKLERSFEHCIKMREKTGLKDSNGEDILLYSYYAPHLGLIKQEMEADGKTKTYMEMDKYVFYDLKPSDMRYGVIIPDLPIKE